MMDYARQRAVQVLRGAHAAVLATTGPAGVQASEFSCEAIDLELYLLVPKTSDHLFNLEHDSNVALLTGEWELRGQAHLVPLSAAPTGLALLGEPQAEWCALVRVHPSQVQIRRENGWGHSETIDVAPS